MLLLCNSVVPLTRARDARARVKKLLCSSGTYYRVRAMRYAYTLNVERLAGCLLAARSWRFCKLYWRGAGSLGEAGYDDGSGVLGLVPLVVYLLSC